MILLSFVLFAILIVAWLVAPSTEKAPDKATVPVLQLSELPAD